MKLECVKNNLKEALLAAERFTGKQLSLPVLKFVLLVAGERSLKIRATNLDIGIEIEVPAKIQKEGVMAVPADILGNFLSNLPSEKNVTIEQVNQNLTLSGASFSTLIKGTGYEDFPTLPFVTKGVSVEIDAKALLSGFRSTMFAVSTSDIKPEFASVYCYSDDHMLVFVGTDSSRLSEKKIPFKKSLEQISILIPGKNVAELVRALEHIDGKVEMKVAKNQISLFTEGLQITSRLIDGTFPDYKQIIPKQYSTEAIVLRQDLLDRLKLTTVFSGKLQQIRLKIHPAEKLIEVESRSEDIGETSHQMEATLKGDSVELLLNQRYLIDMISITQSDSINLLAAGSGKPLVMKGVGDSTFTYLVMPMKG
jgi:DNA polymerase III subunit beta